MVDGVYQGKTYQLIANVYPQDATFKNITWTSSNPKVATVDARGKVTIKTEGSVKIIAKDNVSGIVSVGTLASGTFNITVKKTPVSRITLSLKNKTLRVKRSFTLRATVYPKNATLAKKVTWKSSNKKIATVSSSGKVVGRKKGKVTITATVDGRRAKCIVTVKK